jgi:hypothetical protein
LTLLSSVTQQAIGYQAMRNSEVEAVGIFTLLSTSACLFPAIDMAAKYPNVNAGPSVIPAPM